MRITIITMLCFTLGWSAAAQKKLLEKAMSSQSPAEIEFYSDEALTQKLEKVEDGTMEFYIKVPIKKNLAQKCQNYPDTKVSINWNKNRSDVYKHSEDLPNKMINYAKGEGYLSYKIDFSDEDKSNLIWYYIQDAEKKEYNLICEFKGGRNRGIRLGEGTIKIDLTNGNNKYMAYQLSKKSDYVFDREDAFIDNSLKAEIVNHFKVLKKVTITNFAWGERVPYTENATNYRRHSASVTYRDESDGKCYSAGLSIFTNTPYPRSDYKFDGESAYLNNSELLPCDKI